VDQRSSQTGAEGDQPQNYNIADARRQFSDLVARAEAGEEIVISRSNHPACRLVPLSHAKRRIAGRLKHWLSEEERERLDHALLEPMSEEDLAIAEGVLTDEHGISINPAPKTS
jgi:prevent-host-death family protein